MKNRLDLLSCVGATLSTAVCYIWECVERRREQAVLGFKALFTGGSGSQGANEEATPQQEPVLAYQGHICRATVGKLWRQTIATVIIYVLMRSRGRVLWGLLEQDKGTWHRSAARELSVVLEARKETRQRGFGADITCSAWCDGLTTRVNNPPP